jgi:polyisoprenoid-binding protein YceI
MRPFVIVPLTVAVMALSLGHAAGAQTRDTVRLDSRRGSQVWIEGSSNVTDWRCRATAFDARIELDPGNGNRDAGLAKSLRTIDVRVAVRDLKCGNRKMEHDLYAALRASDPEKPAFIIGRFDVVPDSASGESIATLGALSVAGVERTVSVPVTTGPGSDGTIRASGSVSLRMTDFGVTPPVGLFGLIRSRNEVTVRFDLVVPPRTLAVLPPR